MFYCASSVYSSCSDDTSFLGLVFQTFRFGLKKKMIFYYALTTIITFQCIFLMSSRTISWSVSCIQFISYSDRWRLFLNSCVEPYRCYYLFEAVKHDHFWVLYFQSWNCRINETKWNHTWFMYVLRGKYTRNICLNYPILKSRWAADLFPRLKVGIFKTTGFEACNSFLQIHDAYSPWRINKDD